MNSASRDQMNAVASYCEFYESADKRAAKMAKNDQLMSCELCKNWDYNRCVINVFDNVLTSIDQT